MTDVKTRLAMAWTVLRGRSVMYRWHGTEHMLIPKTAGAMAVENTGAITTSFDVVDAGSDDSRLVADTDSDDSRLAADPGEPTLDLRDDPIEVDERPPQLPSVTRGSGAGRPK